MIVKIPPTRYKNCPKPIPAIPINISLMSDTIQPPFNFPEMTWMPLGGGPQTVGGYWNSLAVTCLDCMTGKAAKVCPSIGPAAPCAFDSHPRLHCTVGGGGLSTQWDHTYELWFNRNSSIICVSYLEETPKLIHRYP